MTINRREFLRTLGVLTASAGIAAGCAPLASFFPDGNLSLARPAGLSPLDWITLNRISFGPRGSELVRLTEIGLTAYLDEQLNPAGIQDREADLLLSRFPVLEKDADDLRNQGDKLFDNYDPDLVLDPFRQATLLRQVYSRRQLYEVMVEFWTDHFNISVHKGDCWFLKVVDDREVIRAHALGNFRSLLGASAHSPAMLVYLDNQENHRAAPNENYARELLELHTLGVNGGYSQDDVMNLARVLTGWRVKDHFWRGEIHFDGDAHTPGPKQILGRTIQPAGAGEIDQVLDILAVNASTAEHIALKLTRKFLGDPPPTPIVSRASQAFLDSNGEILPTLRVILLDGLAHSRASSISMKYKRPVNYLVSALRQTGSDTNGGPALQDFLRQLGQSPYGWPTPDGYPDTSSAWQGNLLPRWRFALELVQGQIKGTSFDLDQFLQVMQGDTPRVFIQRAAQILLGRRLSPSLETDLLQALKPTFNEDPAQAAQLVLASLIASPAFQWR